MPSPAQDVVNDLVRTMTYEAAVAWVHSAALVTHATDLALIGEPASVEAGVEAIASAHPRLAPLADPSVNRMWTSPLTVDQRERVAKLWATESVSDLAARSDGYALGDLYQALSVESRKGRALCQTPRFVTDLLLDLSVSPAREAFGPDLRIIDPSCGTGHILIEALIEQRAALPAHRGRRGQNMEEALPAVHGVDLDGYAAAIAAYRLLALVCRSNGRRWPLAAASGMPVNVAQADALLGCDPLLERGRYHAVVGNPPYMTIKDPAVAGAVRHAYPQVCHRKFSAALPFFQLMTDLLVPGGWCAQLTANSFMKREFGAKFITDYLPRLDLQWVIDTSGAYIPGHGTPTVILVHRNQAPTSETVRCILGKRGEPKAPADPARGLVWTAIASAVRERLSVDRFARAAGLLDSTVPTEPDARPILDQSAELPLLQPSLLELLPAGATS